MTDPLRVGLVLDDPGIQLQVLDWIRELHGSDGIQSLTPNVITPRWTAASGGVIDFLVCDTLDTIKNSHSVLGTCSPSSFVVIGPPISESRLFPFFAQGLVDAVINADLSKQRISIWLGQAWERRRLAGEVERHLRESRRLQDAMLAFESASAVGQDVFESLARHVALTLGVHYAIIAERLESDSDNVRTRAFWSKGEFLPNIEYDVRKTPCAESIEGRLCFYPDDIQLAFPQDEALKAMDVRSFIGGPLMDSSQRVLGHMAILDTHSLPQADEFHLKTVFQVFADRAAIELERDSTRRKLQQTAEAYADQQRVMGSVFACMAEGVIVADSAGHVMYANDRARDLLGLEGPIEGITEWPIIYGIHQFEQREPLPAERFPLRLALQGQSVDHQDLYCPRSSGKPGVYLSVNSRPLRDSEGRISGGVAILRDVTDRRHAEERAQQHELQLSHVHRLSTMGEMATGLAHELNQPLTAIVNYNQGCIRRIRTGGYDEQAILEVMDGISRQAVRAGEIIRRLRTFVERREPLQEVVDLNKLIEEVGRFVDGEARQNGVAIELDLVARPLRVQVDKIQTEQVLISLIRNAIEALEGVDRIAGPGLHGSRVIIESSLLESGLAAVDVTDTGAGLVSETREKIFDAFFSTKSAGLGMGLPISRSIVTRHQGTLDVLRTGPEGSTFRFTLPLVGGGASGRGESENRGLK